MPDLTVPELIRTRGFWDVTIRPSTFEDRLSLAELPETIRSSVVRLRGWPVPFVGGRHEERWGDDYFGQDIDARELGHFEAWRFYSSGQFAQMRSFGLDWETKVASTQPPDQTVLPVWEVVFYLTELFELASRLALSKAGGEQMVVEGSLNGVRGRRLIAGSPNRSGFDDDYVAGEQVIRFAFSGSRAELASPRRLAVQEAQSILVRFGWRAQLAQLADYQDELTQLSGSR